MHITALLPKNSGAGLTAPVPKPAQPAVQQKAAKVDNVILSEKAKDLAAQQSGQSPVEEAKESASAKALEGPAD